MASAADTVISYASSCVLGVYSHPGSFGPHGPWPSGRRVIIDDNVKELFVEAREESQRLVRGTTTDIGGVVSFCEGLCPKCCHLRVLAEDLEEDGMS